MSDHVHAFDPTDRPDDVALTECTGAAGCTLTYGEWTRTQATVPIHPLIARATGALPIGWHRATWVANGRPRYVVTEEAGAAIDAHTALAHTSLPGVSDVNIEHWTPQ